MAEDIFIPQSNAEDAIAGPLMAVTYVTADPERVGGVLRDGFGLSPRPITDSLSDDAADYLGLPRDALTGAWVFEKAGSGANIAVRVLGVSEDMPQTRPTLDGLYLGGATLSFPMNNLAAHEARMADLGVKSTIGVKEMEFTSPTGETYISAETVYPAPENIYLMGVTRAAIFQPTGPIDPATGMGGPSYSARNVGGADAVVEFFQDMLGYEIRRDVNFTVGERSALLMPEGTTERFIQGFAAGADSGYVVLMDHGDANREGPVSAGQLQRGIAMWTFSTTRFDEIQRRAEAGQYPIRHGATPGLGAGRCMIMTDPTGFPIEIIEADTRS